MKMRLFSVSLAALVGCGDAGTTPPGQNPPGSEVEAPSPTFQLVTTLVGEVDISSGQLKIEEVFTAPGALAISSPNFKATSSGLVSSPGLFSFQLKLKNKSTTTGFKNVFANVRSLNNGASLRSSDEPVNAYVTPFDVISPQTLGGKKFANIDPSGTSANVPVEFNTAGNFTFYMDIWADSCTGACPSGAVWDTAKWDQAVWQ